ncbi:MAG: peptide ABC transporter substrate-binding protein [Lachnospiraceae bacterium]|nr:peptide ABC transporter substrate-binding protein [Lachnospiraceae bacterium]
MKRRTLAILLAATMVVGLAGCSSSSSSSDSPTAAADSAETTAETSDSSGDTADADSTTEKVFRYSVSTEPTTLDPTKGNSIGDNEIQHAITEGLVRNTAGEITPGIAETWEISDDGLTYTFHLREDSYWSDGEQITAQDFVYSLQRLMDPDTASPYAFIGEYIKNGLAVETGEMDPSELGVTAEDDFTLVVELENPTSYFLSLIGSSGQFAPLRQDVVEEYGTEFAATADKNVYSGPYKLVSSENNEYIFEPNEYYWDAESINLDRVELSVIDNTDTALAMYEAGDLDYVSVPTAYVESYSDTAICWTNGNVDYLLFNFDCDNEAIQNKNFRLAINYALSRTEYNTLANSGVYDGYVGLVFSGLTVGDSTYGETYDLSSYSYPVDGDQDKAQEYLAAAMEELGVSDASELSVTITITDSESTKKQGEVIQDLLQTALGITVNLEQRTYSEMYSGVLDVGDYEMAFTGWGPDYDDPYTYLELFLGTGNYNYANYNNEEFDELLNASVTETDETARMDMLNQAEQILMEDGAFVPLQQRNAWYLVDDDVTGLNFYFCSVNIDWVYVDIVS